MFKELKHWDYLEVRGLCIANSWYTHGNNEDYSNMLHYVHVHAIDPTVEDIEKVARDILQHSNDPWQTVSNIMCNLANKTITVTFTED